MKREKRTEKKFKEKKKKMSKTLRDKPKSTLRHDSMKRLASSFVARI